MPIDLVRTRLGNQKLDRAVQHEPEDIVAWLGAVQAQDYGGAKWALGLRSKELTDQAIDRAFDEGRILRTHVLRPTWHFVAPSDIRWILGVSGPRVHAVNRSYYRKVGLDDRIFTRSRGVIERALEGGRQLTRSEIAVALGRAGIAASGMALAYLMMHAELDAIVCSGARRGKQFTYALLEERVPRVRSLSGDEALAALASRYFTSHGPATIRDFVWWSGLTTAQAKTALDLVRPALERMVVDDRTLWFKPSPKVPSPPTCVWLLPNYDEYLIAYKDREYREYLVHRPGRDPFAHHLVADGVLAGSWRRTRQSGSLLVEAATYKPLTPSLARALARQVERLGRFVGLRATLRAV